MTQEATPETSFETLKSNVVRSIQSCFPFEGRKQRVVLRGLTVDDKLAADDVKSQAEAKDHERTWGVPIQAHVALVDIASGKTVDEKKFTLARLPKLTNRYGFIVDGNEYQVDTLFRLKSGVYARVQENGDLESEFNLAKSPMGRGFSIHLDRASKRFTMKIGEAKVPLYAVLKAVGVADEDLEREWGKETFLANRIAKPERLHKALANFHKKTADESAETPRDLAGHGAYVQHFFDQTQLLPDTTKATLGQAFTQVNGDALRAAVRKLIAVNRGDSLPDDRDSLAFKEVVSAEDFIPEKIGRNLKTIQRKMRNVVDHKKEVTDVVSPTLFSKPIQEFFSKGGSIAERPDQTNPVQMISGHRKTTLFSEHFGGIKKEHSITDEMKAVHPSHFGFLDAMHTPESERTGITLYLGAQVKKEGKDLTAPLYELKTGQLSHLKVADYHATTAVLADQVRWVHGKPVPVAERVKMRLPDGKVELRPWKEATHVMPSAKGVFNYSSNLIPFLPCDQGNRVSMADKQLEQAISIKHREAPLVQTKHDAGYSFEEHLGRKTATFAKTDGEVVKVDPGLVVVQSGKTKVEHHLYNHFPLNDPKGMMHSDVVVKVGDKVKKGQLLADNNFTKGGHLAMGANLRVGYMPYKGYNFEDGIVISESAAKKLTSEHLYKKDLELDTERDVVNKRKWLAHYPVKADELGKRIEHLDEDGVVRVGARVEPGSLLVAAIGKNDASKRQAILSQQGARARKWTDWRDKSLVWDEDYVGVVTKVVKSPSGKGIKVYVKTEEPMVIGDKMAGRHGNKGIVTQIRPDDQMPFTKDEKGERQHLEVLLNPSGVPTRINVGQTLETAAAKVAQKTGQAFVVDNFAGPGHDYRQHVEDQLKAHGIEEEEHVYDPADVRRPLGKVLVGPQYLLKLKHQVDKKLAVRGGGIDVNQRPLKHDQDRQPVKGGERGGQAFGQLELYTLLGHNARHNIREMSTYKSDFQEQEFWDRIQAGFEPGAPKVPFSFQKFEALLKGAGINVTKEGTQLRLHPLTDKEILRLADNGQNEVKYGKKTLMAKGDLRPEPGGLFDLQATGGPEGKKWAYVKLVEPLPNPIFVGGSNKPGPVPILLGLSIKDIDAIMAGTQELGGKTGGAAIKEALKGIDVPKELASIKKKLPELQGSDLDRANKKLKFLQALHDNGLQPHEAYVLHHLPLIPPIFRPATPTNRGDISLAPINQLYKNFSILNEKLGEVDAKTYSEKQKRHLREDIWNAFKAMQSVGRYAPVYDESNPNRKLKGILDTIGSGEGEQPKEGFFQAKLIKRRQNLSIRSTIIPEPALHLDEVGLPKGAAMELYKPFVVAKLGAMGYHQLEAQRLIEQRDPSAHRALEQVVAERPLLLKRDPSLHKFSVMAFQPKLTDGKAIQIHPLVCGGFNADFDGDTMAGTVPVSKDAVEEAKKMFPSKNLFSPTTGKVMFKPEQESLLGLHLLTEWGKKSGKRFKTVAELARAVEKGELAVNDVVHVAQVGAKETTYGRILIESHMPRAFALNKDILHSSDFLIDKKTISQVSTRLAKEHPGHFSEAINALKDLGNEHSFKVGFTLGLKDLKPFPGRDAILKRAHVEADKARAHLKGKELDAKLVAIYNAATEELESAAKTHYKGSDNRLAKMVYSGARGKEEQFRQMVAAPMLVQDNSNRVLPTPVTRSYAEGLDLGDYWLTQNGARKGTLQRSQGTSDPGALSKDILNSTISTLVVSHDCKTKEGVHMALTHEDVHDRYTATDYKLKDGTVVKAGSLLTPEVVSRLRSNKHDKVLVRSPLKCQHGSGICAKCFGLNENGHTHDVGTNIGILAGQAMGEPATQLAMDAFHSGGVASGAGAGSVDRFTRLRQLLGLPKQLKGQATLASRSGKVTELKKGELGGWDIFIDGEHHHQYGDINPELKVGHEVKKGDSLGAAHVPINPHHLLQHRDMPAVQNYITNELYSGLYKKEGVRRRNIEVVVRAFTNLTKVKDPGHSDWAHGDIVPASVVDEHNRTLSKGQKAVVHEPILKAMTEVPVTGTEDWMARLNYRQLHGTIQRGAQMGWKSELHGANPLPGIAHGAEFGKPPPGKPAHVY